MWDINRTMVNKEASLTMNGASSPINSIYYEKFERMKFHNFFAFYFNMIDIIEKA